MALRATSAALLVLVALLPGAGTTAARGVEPAAVQVHHAAAVPPVEGEVVRPFDPPSTPYGAGHRGVDLAAEPGTPVRAALTGTVTFSGQVAGRGWVTVDHGGGLDTTYGWIDPRRVGRGERLGTGQVLGRLAADATHLDWGARLDGGYIDPRSLLGPWRSRLVPVGER